MKYTTLKTLNILFLLSILLFARCHKSDESAKTKTELITAAPWKFNQAGVDINMDGTIDQPLRPDLIPNCSTDNAFTFNTDGTGILDEGLSQCNPSAPKTSIFNWNFLNNETDIYMSVNILPVYGGTLKIVELTENRFALSKQVGIHGFPAYLTIVIVFVH